MMEAGTVLKSENIFLPEIKMSYQINDQNTILTMRWSNDDFIFNSLPL